MSLLLVVQDIYIYGKEGRKTGKKEGEKKERKEEGRYP